jgi:hypothetical protein
VRFFRRRDANQVPQVTIPRRLAVPDLSEPVEMTGTTTTTTTTVGADALAMLYAAHDRAAGGLLELEGRLIHELENPADSNAVHIVDARIGYVPGFITRGIPQGRALECQVQLWATPTPKGLRVRGWVAAGSAAAG